MALKKQRKCASKNIKKYGSVIVTLSVDGKLSEKNGYDNKKNTT